MKNTDQFHAEIAAELQALSYLFKSQDLLTYEEWGMPNNEIGQGIGRLVGRLEQQVSKIAKALDLKDCRKEQPS